MDDKLAWRTLAAADLDAVAALAADCLAADGGLPLIADAGYLRGRFLAPGGVATGAVDPAGALVAAGAV
ncbi:MAG TPA: GNAT family N-acetyltransferase, partial [Micromonospora sp.]